MCWCQWRQLFGHHVVTLSNLTFICRCITNIFPNYSQQDATFLHLLISKTALRVSGGCSAHHQEHKNCTYSFRYCQPILLLAAIVDEMEFYRSSSTGRLLSCTQHCDLLCIFAGQEFHLIHDSS